MMLLFDNIRDVLVYLRFYKSSMIEFEVCIMRRKLEVFLK